ncbi:serine hydrolase, partial [Pseudemcibacter sp.]|uniref:serine hydrolase n=1 Tax=Pseudemcibacter sp. TaxID=2943293 RepID=UPI003F6A1A30
MIYSRLMKKINVSALIFLILTLANSATAQVNQGMSLDRLNRIDKVMQDYIDQDQLSGNVIYIARNGETVYHKALGQRDVAANDNMERSDIFRIASQSKAI